jgi:hypothetical protein
MDSDGFVRNTFLVRVTNKEASANPTPFHVRVEGLPADDVTVQDFTLGTTENATIPMVIRMKADAALPRTIPIQVHVSSPSHEVRLDATFKTEGNIGTDSQ